MFCSLCGHKWREFVQINLRKSANKLVVNRKMGSSSSLLTEDMLEEYVTLTYLSSGEILYLLKQFRSLGPEKMDANYHHRFHKEEILPVFGVLRNNPFQDRLFRVFSSQRDNRFSFEDMIDLYSAMSSDCPADVKAAWAFRIFDIDEDNEITNRDISDIIERLTWDRGNPQNRIDEESKLKIGDHILQEIKLNNSGGIGCSEFQILLSRIPEFTSSFYFGI